MFEPKSLGRQAASEYLENGVPLDESITKIARENALNPDQVARVAEEANLVTYQSMFEKSADKTFDFPLASTRNILNDLSEREENEKVSFIKKTANIQKSYEFDIASEKRANQESLVEKSGIDIEKTASSDFVDNRERNQSERDAGVLSSAKRHYELEKVSHSIKIEAIKDILSEQIKTALISGTSAQDLHTAISKHSDNDQNVMGLLDEIWDGYSENHKTSIKIAQEKIHFKVHPEDKGTIVNPEHPILKSVDAYRSSVKDLCDSEDKKNYVCDAGTKIRMSERMRTELDSSGNEKNKVYYKIGPEIKELYRESETAKKASIVSATIAPVKKGAKLLDDLVLGGATQKGVQAAEKMSAGEAKGKALKKAKEVLEGME